MSYAIEKSDQSDAVSSNGKTKMPFANCEVGFGFDVPTMDYSPETIRAACVYWSGKLGRQFKSWNKRNGYARVDCVGTCEKVDRAKPVRAARKPKDDDNVPGGPPPMGDEEAAKRAFWQRDNVEMMNAYKAECERLGEQPGSASHAAFSMAWRDRKAAETAPDGPGLAPPPEPEPGGGDAVGIADATPIASSIDANGNSWAF